MSDLTGASLQENLDVKKGTWVNTLGGNLLVGAFFFDPPSGTLQTRDFHPLDSPWDSVWTIEEEVETIRQALLRNLTLNQPFFMAMLSSYDPRAISAALKAAGEDSIAVHEIRCT